MQTGHIDAGHPSSSDQVCIKKRTLIHCFFSSHEGKYRTDNARANIPTAFGAAADVPPWPVVHLSLPTSVVT